MVRGGRRPGNSGSREAILKAAREQFAQSGYEAATIRAIAARAEVDPALVHHFFGSKEQVFIAAVELPIDPEALIGGLLAEGLDGIGERLVRTMLGLWEDPRTGAALLGVVRSAVSHDRAAAMIREFFQEAVFGRIAARLGRPDPLLRSNLVGSQVVGLAMFRYVIKIEPLASADHDTIVAAIAPTLQRYISEDLIGR